MVSASLHQQLLHTDTFEALSSDGCKLKFTPYCYQFSWILCKDMLNKTLITTINNNKVLLLDRKLSQMI